MAFNVTNIATCKVQIVCLIKSYTVTVVHENIIIIFCPLVLHSQGLRN